MTNSRSRFIFLAFIAVGMVGCGSDSNGTIATDEEVAAFVEEKSHLMSGQAETVEEEYISPQEMERQALGRQAAQ